jgi:hypothetical protein
VTVTDANGCTASGSGTLTLIPAPNCTVVGDHSVCSGSVGHVYHVTSNQGGPTFSWAISGNATIIGTTTDSTVTVNAGAAGTYMLTVTVTEGDCARTCSLEVTVNTCNVNCPRTPGFWTQQCAQKSGGSTKFTASEVTQIADCVDNRAVIFSWSDDFAGFCAIINQPLPMDQRKQAKRQYAAFLANVCTGQLGLVANNGAHITLDLTTAIAYGNLTSTTLGELIGEVDALLISLEGQSLSDPAVKSKYGNLISCLDAINNGIGIGTVCRGDGQTIRGGLGLRTSPMLTAPAPNPFRSTTWFHYSIDGSASKRVDLRVFDVSGRLVRVLVTGYQAPGRYESVWDGRTDSGARVPDGLYFVHSAVGDQRSIARVLYLH